MTTEKRIKLAEAMGYVTTRQSKEWHGKVWEGLTPEGDHSWRLPNPWSDANDDYAVLEWMRSLRGLGIGDNRWGWWGKFSDTLTLRCRDYQIGDYANAALKVIEGTGE